MPIWDFFNLKTAINFSEKHTGQQTCSLLTLFNFPIYEVRRKFDKNCIKTLKFGKFWVFCHFQFQFDIFFIWKTAIISSEKPTVQLILVMLSVFNILIHDVYREKDKNCINTLKIGNFLNFCHFRGRFGWLWGHFRHSQKVQISLQIHIARS